MIKLKEFLNKLSMNNDINKIKLVSVRGFIDVTEILKDKFHVKDFNNAKVDGFRIVGNTMIIVVYK